MSSLPPSLPLFRFPALSPVRNPEINLGGVEDRRKLPYRGVGRSPAEIELGAFQNKM